MPRADNHAFGMDVNHIYACLQTYKDRHDDSQLYKCTESVTDTKGLLSGVYWSHAVCTRISERMHESSVVERCRFSHCWKTHTCADDKGLGHIYQLLGQKE